MPRFQFRKQEVGGYRNQHERNGRERKIEGRNMSYGALQIILDLIEIYRELSRSAPLVQKRTANGWKVITRMIATKALRRMVSSLGRKKSDTLHPPVKIGGEPRN